MPFKQESPCDLRDNFFERIGTDWMLVCAGTANHHNAMTASWGQIGNLWNKPVATCYVRPQRYTYEFMEKNGRFTLCFFEPGQRRRELELLGTKSGRDGDKLAEAGLAVEAFGPHKAPGIAQAALVLVCRKLYAQDMRPECFVEEPVRTANYPGGDYHRMYVGEVEAVYRQD